MVLKFDQVVEIVGNLTDEVRSIMPVTKVILFGSYAKGEATDESDIDVCFILDSFQNRSKLDILVDILVIAQKFMPIEIQTVAYLPSDFLKGGNFFLYEVMRTGIEVWPATPSVESARPSSNNLISA